MSKQRNKLIALALVGACSFGVWKAGQAIFGEAETQGTKHAVNQVWIDHIPRDDRDMITHFVLIDHRDGQFGAIGRSSQWRHIVDIFKWQLQRDTLRVYFPQEKAKGSVKIETWDCEGEAPSPFELCMRLTGKDGSAMLYSRYEWEIDPHDAADSIAEVTDNEPALAGIGADELERGATLPEIDLDAAEDWPARELL